MDTLTPTCQATSKQTKKRCGNFAVRDRNVCHIHGGKTPKHNSGPRTAEGRLRQKNANLKHGLRSKEVIEERRNFSEVIKSCRRMIQV